MNNGFSDLIKEPFTILSILAGMIIIDARLTLAAMVILPLVILPILIVGNRIKRLARQTVSVGISQGSGLIEALSGIRLIKAYGLENFQLDRYRRESLELVNLEVKENTGGQTGQPGHRGDQHLGIRHLYHRGLCDPPVSLRFRRLFDRVGHATQPSQTPCSDACRSGLSHRQL